MIKLSQFLLLSCLLVSNVLCAQFSPGTEYIRSTSEPTDLKTGDLDNNGWKDMVVFHSEDDQIGWFRNLGNGQYAQQEIIGSTINAHSIELVDYDQDGDLDVFAASFYTLVQFTNLGNGTFSSGTEITNQASIGFTSNDIDNDGDTDLLLTTYNPWNVYLYENTGGSFSTGTIIVSGVNSLKDFRFADLDGDSFSDLLFCSDFNNLVAWYKNNGDGSFSTQQVIYTGQTQPLVVDYGDIDGDGDTDVISANGSDVRCYLNQGTGTFGPVLFVSTSIWGVTDMCVKDLNGDQQMEVVFNYYTLPIMSSRLGVFKYTSGSGFSFDSYITDGNGATKVIADDMDNDGDNDILNLNNHYQVLLNYNDGTSHFGADIPLSIYGAPNRGSLVDVDVDGDMDILAENGSIAYWLENLGDSTYGAVYQGLPVPTYAGSTVGVGKILMADFSNDGLPDLIYGISPVFYYQNLGNGAFAPPVYITTTQQNITDLAAEDFNGDGKLDLLAGSTDEAAWYRNTGNNTFSAQMTLGTAQHCEAIFTSDLDNDGKKDVLFASELDNAVKWCKNLGNSFAAAVTIPINNIKPNGIYAADLDGDGDMELLVASRDDDKISWYENLGSGTFGSEHVISTTTETAFDVWSEDFDLDGDYDILAVGLGDVISWYENIGGSTFGPRQDISDQPLGVSKLFCGDADNDGDVDILEINWSFNSIRIYENYNISSMQVKGRLFVDENQNALYETSEIAIPQLSIQCNPAAAYTYSYPDGRYFMLFNGLMGNYQITADSLLFWNTTTPNSYNVTIGPNFTSVNDLNFGFYPDSLIDTLEIALIGGFPRCNEHVNYWFDLENIGTTYPSGIVDIMLDDSLTYVSANITPDSIVGQHVYWSYDSLDYFETMQIKLEVIMPDFNSMGNSLVSTATVSSDTMGTIVFTTVDTLEQVVTCAYDPNDKAAWPAGEGIQGYIWPAPEKIEYLIRFQNTGNDTARTVIIRDQLNNNLDWTSLRPIAGSHPYHVERTLGGEASFIFENIMLPDSNVNEAGSHGFVLYSIDVIPGLPLGTVVENTANIYFDFNPAVITNTVIHTFDTIPVSTTGLNEINNLGSIHMYPNPFDGSITLQTQDLDLPYSIEVFDLSGQRQFCSPLIHSQECQFDLSLLTNGLYLIQLKDKEGYVIAVKKVIRK
ncbi:FG-GAP repeat protein [compost metagenome]